MRDALSMFDKAVSFCGTTLDFLCGPRRSTCWITTPIPVLRRCCSQATTSTMLVNSVRCFRKVFGTNLHGRTQQPPHTTRPAGWPNAPDAAADRNDGTLLEHYRTQAGACNVSSCSRSHLPSDGLDGKISVVNQRLLVPSLGLIIAGLGQK